LDLEGAGREDAVVEEEEREFGEEDDECVEDFGDEEVLGGSSFVSFITVCEGVRE
jgi:hypothetical protein